MEFLLNNFSADFRETDSILLQTQVVIYNIYYVYSCIKTLFYYIGKAFYLMYY